jgi:pyrroloquinoline quinone (PQQ) biosynthesis protein C
MSMTAFSELQGAWPAVERRFMSSPPIQRLRRGDLTLAHYASYLRETYFYTREDPQIQALCTAWLRGSDREMVKPFLQHATSEIGHDQLALDDLRSLGFDADAIPRENPLPMTTALISFPFYTIQYRGPISYLGYLYFLEFLPTSRGADIAAALSAIGVPAESMRFLHEHQTVDVHHNRLMQRYADEMVRAEADVAEVTYAMEVTGRLFEGMLTGAFEAVDQGRFRSDREKVLDLVLEAAT